MKKIPVTVIVPVKNEEKNLSKCLSLLDDFSEVIVVDSHSTDHTPDIVKGFGFKCIDFSWNGQCPKKRNWVLENIPLENEWVLFLDADEYITDLFKEDLIKSIDTSNFNGLWVYYVNYFMGKQLRYGVKMRKLALFKKDKGKYEWIEEKSWSHLDMEIHEHPIVEGNIGAIKSPIIHMDYNGLEYYISKHNAYSTWEAKRYLNLTGLKKEFTWRQRIKYSLLDTWFYWIIYFLYSYFFCLGFLDGKTGLLFNLFKMQYFFQVKCKILELRGKY